MRGISEEMLNKCYDSALRMDDKIAIPGLEIALAMCTELNPWQPIDENTPKDRPILMCGSSIFKGRWSAIDNSWIEDSGLLRNPKQWTELPEPPK